MAKQHIVTCRFCKEKFDINKIEGIELKPKYYVHKECYEKQENKIKKEEKDYKELEEIIKKIFGKTYLNAKIKKQIRDYKQEYNYTYTGMTKCLNWWFIQQKNPIEKAQNGIGIIPYIYDEVQEMYYKLWLAQNANSQEKIKNYEIKTREIEIEPPQKKNKNIKFFKIGE